MAAGKGKYIEVGAGETFKLGGLTQVLKLSAEDTDGKFALVEDTLVPHFRAPLHVHYKTDETFTIIEGEAEFQIGDEKKLGTAGMTMHVPMGTKHAVKSGDKGMRMITQFTPGGLEGMTREISQHFASGTPDPDKVAEIGARYDTEWLEPFGG